jgi:hypothetical protein
LKESVSIRPYLLLLRALLELLRLHLFAVLLVLAGLAPLLPRLLWATGV